jgi:hypothetical protein
MIKLTQEERHEIVQALKLAILLVREMEMDFPLADRWQLLANRLDRITEDTPPP